jgi:hypothetical protein
MSLSEDLRRELTRVAPASDCDRLAELSGLFHSAGRFHIRGRGEVSLHLDVSESAVARRAFRLLRDVGVGSSCARISSAFWGDRYQPRGGADALGIPHDASRRSRAPLGVA